MNHCIDLYIFSILFNIKNIFAHSLESTSVNIRLETVTPSANVGNFNILTIFLIDNLELEVGEGKLENYQKKGVIQEIMKSIF